MSLRDWLGDGSVRELPSSSTEIARILALVDRNLHDAGVVGLSQDRQFSLAYEAALDLCTIVVRASGYRVASSSTGHHWKTITLMSELMGPNDRSRSRYLDSCRRARNHSTYEQVGTVSKEEVAELLGEVMRMRNDVLAWLHATHPAL